MNQLEVQIMGQSYLLVCPVGGESRLREAVERVDQAMCKIRDAGKVRARDRIAVLAALNLAFDLGDQQSAQAISGTTQSMVVASQLAATAESGTLAALITRLDNALSEDGRLL